METNILKDMLSKHPEDLTGESLKLFNAIMSIADERDELKESIKHMYYDEVIYNLLEDKLGMTREEVKELLEESEE